VCGWKLTAGVSCSLLSPAADGVRPHRVTGGQSCALTLTAPAPVPALSVDVTSLDAGAGGSVQVTGTGYGSASDNGFYVALIEQGERKSGAEGMRGRVRAPPVIGSGTPGEACDALALVVDV